MEQEEQHVHAWDTHESDPDHCILCCSQKRGDLEEAIKEIAAIAGGPPRKEFGQGTLYERGRDAGKRCLEIIWVVAKLDHASLERSNDG